MDRSCDIDLSLTNIWRSWYRFRAGKKSGHQLDELEYYLEDNLFGLYEELESGAWWPGGYRQITIRDNKTRQISIAPVRDRVVHRLLYDYLVGVYDKTFIYDVWSCRRDKGVHGAIDRVQGLLARNRYSYVWRADIEKFFDNIDRPMLLKILALRLSDTFVLDLLKRVIDGPHVSEYHAATGIPIGNLTSQILANIYLNELDRFVVHTLKPSGYVRYGDDFILTSNHLSRLKEMRQATSSLLGSKLKLKIHHRHDIIVPARRGIKFLGGEIYPTGRRLQKNARRSIYRKLSLDNSSSYFGLLAHMENAKCQQLFQYILYNQIHCIE